MPTRNPTDAKPIDDGDADSSGVPRSISSVRVLMVHSYYQLLGGEDVVFDAESEMLTRFGHQVFQYTRSNAEIEKKSGIAQAVDAVWNRMAAEKLASLVREHQIDLVHVHNEFPTLSGSIFHAAKRAGAAVVKTLHNARPLCPKAVRFRDGLPCESCVQKRFAWRGVAEGCYRDNRLATAVSSFSSLLHHWKKSLSKHVDVCIAPTQNVRDLYQRSGYEIGQIVVKPHFVETDLGMGQGSGGFALYAGRLSEEKGLTTLLDAWNTLAERAGEQSVPQLHVIGDGPLADRMVQRGPLVNWIGQVSKDEVYRHMGRAACLILPSACSETFGRVAVEAFSRGTPVICADHGGQAEVVHDEVGMRFVPGDSNDLARKVQA
ncbi:MAG: glycosyltransferase, partial [Planctomycetota bacterium]